jgi:uncharacterized protein (DUF1501 family)
MSAPRHVSRRELLAAGALLPFSTGILARAAAAAGTLPALAGERVLVVVELVGGNDGLNTVVPHVDDLYQRARPVVAIESNRVARLTSTMGLNPAIADLMEVWEQGQLAVVQGVGPPVPNRSHFRSREIWHTARMDDPASTEGWLGRAAPSLSHGDLPMVRVGEREASLALAGSAGEVPTLGSLTDLELLTPPEGPNLDLLCGSTLGRQGVRAEVARAMGEARRVSADLSRIDDSQVGLPGTSGRLGRSLGLAAKLIGAHLGTRVLYVTQPGYDTHAGQVSTQNAHLRELGGALQSFQQALGRQGDGGRVVTMVFSEFGRRVEENASGGTDHGAAGPVFLMGEPVAGGVLGDDPDLDGPEDHDVPVTLDFRRIYSDLLEWLGVDTGLVLPGPFESLSLLGSSGRR